MLLEPWCLTPAQVAGLTHWQVRTLYLEPQARVIAEMKGEPPPGPLRVSDALPDKEEFVLGMQAQFGGTPEKWAADYDRMAAEVEASKEKGK